MSLDRLKRNLYSILKEHHGPGIVIKNVILVNGNMDYLDYEIVIKYKTINRIKETTHHVTTLTGNGDIPYTIDGKLTEFGKQICDDLAEFGELMGVAFN